MADHTHSIDVSALVDSTYDELERICSESGEEHALLKAGGMLAAAAGFLALRRSPLHAISVLDSQVSGLEDIEARRRAGTVRRMVH